MRIFFCVNGSIWVRAPTSTANKLKSCAVVLAILMIIIPAAV